MKLSEAILLGDSLKKACNFYWIAVDDNTGELCGCAFGGALLATGLTVREFNKSGSRLRSATPFISAMDRYSVAETDCVLARWPWIKREHLFEISKLYASVIAGERTIEQVADYARSVEPVEIETETDHENQTEMVNV